jgi:L-amino acid N-acyltransferase YncA
MSSRSEVVLRLATPDDAAALVNVFSAAIIDQAPGFYAAAQCEAWAASLTIDQAVELISEHVTYVAEVTNTGEVVGFATFTEPDEFDMLYVHPEHLAQGIGTRLAALIEHHAHTSGVRELRATVSDCARIAFESFGFRHEKPHTKTVRDQSFSVTLMSKSLG